MDLNADDQSISNFLGAWNRAVGNRVIHPAREIPLLRGKTLPNGWRHPVMSGIVMVPHRTCPSSVNVIVVCDQLQVDTTQIVDFVMTGQIEAIHSGASYFTNSTIPGHCTSIP